MLNDNEEESTVEQCAKERLISLRVEMTSGKTNGVLYASEGLSLIS